MCEYICRTRSHNPFTLEMVFFFIIESPRQTRCHLSTSTLQVLSTDKVVDDKNGLADLQLNSKLPHHLFHLLQPQSAAFASLFPLKRTEFKPISEDVNSYIISPTIMGYSASIVPMHNKTANTLYQKNWASIMKMLSNKKGIHTSKYSGGTYAKT